MKQWLWALVWLLIAASQPTPTVAEPLFLATCIDSGSLAVASALHRRPVAVTAQTPGELPELRAGYRVSDDNLPHLTAYLHRSARHNQVLLLALAGPLPDHDMWIVTVLTSAASPRAPPLP